MALTREQVIALAPDNSSVKAATGLCADGKWQALGADAEALWGECKGSGSRPYQTQVDLTTTSTKCSCPSRKFPCKHALALLLMSAQNNPRFAQNSARPDWVDAWLSARRERTEKKEQRAAEAKPVDPEAQQAAAAKRAASRWKKIESGCTDLQRWIADLFQQGFANIASAQYPHWHSMAARMVDAQAPGLAQRIETALELFSGDSANHQQAIEEIGLIQLIAAAVLRRKELSELRQADLRTALGWPMDREDVLAGADRVEDHWQVLGLYSQMRDARLNERRVWLHGRDSGRYALLLEFAFQGKGWEGAWFPGRSYRAALSFYPGHVPLRAIAHAQEAAGDENDFWPHTAAGESVDQASRWFAANPWLAAVPLLLERALFCKLDEGWFVQTRQARFPLCINETNAWTLLAFGGGHPLHIIGEWDGRRLRPLSARHIGHDSDLWLVTGEDDA